ncbi:MAG TPA: bacillithiol biosynthesis BshC, partial [candidate division Zixibacteria bacterium]|nr:bacillithiol biosynthesis BshC [candidate division Zixibacteria bacterium]
ILQHGYQLQVEKSDQATHLFYNLDGRKPVLRDGGKFKVADKIFSKAELVKLIEKEPEKFSPDVLTRPVFQSFLFPVLSQRGGPAEIAYLAQSGGIFELFNLPAPVYQSRPSATFVEKHFEKMMSEYKIRFEDLTGDIEQVINSVLANSFPADLERNLSTLKSRIAEEFDRFKSEAVKFDPALKDFSDQTFGKIDFALKNLESKVFASHKKKSQDVRNRIYRLWHALFPNRGLQERSVNIGYFISKYGFDFINFMYDQIDINEKHHQLISMTDYKTK